jgi:LysM repeat protein
MRYCLALIFFGLTPLFAQSNQLAGMQQDIADLKTEVEKLKLENQDLRESLAREKASKAPASSTTEANTRQRKEILDEVDRRLKQQTTDVNAALAEITRQVNTALNKPAVAKTKSPSTPATNSASPATESTAPAEALPTDIPHAGVTYRVKSGDSVSRIARQLNSKPEWILKANKLASPAALKADVEIFVPQSDTPAQ